MSAISRPDKRLLVFFLLSLEVLALNLLLLLISPASGQAQVGAKNVTVYTDTVTISIYSCNTSTHLRFIIPSDQVQVHSRDPNDNFLPPDGGMMNWPSGPGRNMSRLGQWNGWFGFFAYPQSQVDFAGMYDPSLQEGVIPVFPK